MKFIARWDDKDILEAVVNYRRYAHDKHGPISLNDLRWNVMVVANAQPHVPSKSTMHYRIKDLIKRGLLAGMENDRGVVTSTLYVTKAGKEFLANG